MMELYNSFDDCLLGGLDGFNFRLTVFVDFNGCDDDADDCAAEDDDCDDFVELFRVWMRSVSEIP